MIIKYDYDNNCEIYTCGVCGHTYHYYYDSHGRSKNEEKPFIKIEQLLNKEVERPWEFNKTERVLQYACPICGVLQIAVD